MSRCMRLFVVLAGLGSLSASVNAGDPEPQIVTFPAADGFTLTADYYPPPAKPPGDAPFAILLHMYRSDRKSWQPLIPPLCDAGFAVLALDLRGHGESATTETRDVVEKRDPEVFKKMQDDLRGAYDWLATQPRIDRARFALVGASVGCSLALRYAAEDCSVDAIVCLSPGLNYMQIDSAGDIRQLGGRHVLMLATPDERDAPYTLKQKAAQEVNIQIYDGHKAHGTNMFGTVPEMEQTIVNFLRRAVGEPSTSVVVGSIKSNIYHQPGTEWAKRIAPQNLRCYSSPAEAESRGLRAAKSRGPRESGADDEESPPPRKPDRKKKS